MIDDMEKFFGAISQLYQIECNLPTAQGPYNTTCTFVTYMYMLLTNFKCFGKNQTRALFATKGHNYQPLMFHIFLPGELNAHDQSFS